MRQLNKAQMLLARRLTYSGTLPLLLCSIGYYAHNKWINCQAAGICYAMLIIAFLSGIHWAIYLANANKCPNNLFLRSNATTLFAFATCFIPQPIPAIGIELICFSALLYWDKSLQSAGLIPLWFYQLRRNATFIVSVLLVSLV